MDISHAISLLKQEPGFADNVGMVLVHNGIVRGSSRSSAQKVTKVTIKPNLQKIQAICAEQEQQPGIFRIVAHAKTGTFQPGDDILFIIVAGDFRENVQRTLSTVLNTIKSEAVFKEEIFADK